MRPPRLLYAWLDPQTRVFRISRIPPDGIIRPSIAFDTKAEALEFAERKRATLYWWPPLHRDVA
jgi:hypothetical protein